MTQDLRKNELGILTLGTGAGSYAISIPPGSDNFELTTYCFKHCSEKVAYRLLTKTTNLLDPRFFSFSSCLMISP